MLLKEDIFWFV